MLISTWRKVFPPDFTQDVLSRLGLFELFHDDWMAKLHVSSAKAHDIAHWLGDHQSIRRQDVVVIDDEDLMLRPAGIHQHVPVSNVGSLWLMVPPEGLESHWPLWSALPRHIGGECVLVVRVPAR